MTEYTESPIYPATSNARKGFNSEYKKSPGTREHYPGKETQSVPYCRRTWVRLRVEGSLRARGWSSRQPQIYPTQPYWFRKRYGSQFDSFRTESKSPDMKVSYYNVHLFAKDYFHCLWVSDTVNFALTWFEILTLPPLRTGPSVLPNLVVWYFLTFFSSLRETTKKSGKGMIVSARNKRFQDQQSIKGWIHFVKYSFSLCEVIIEIKIWFVEKYIPTKL